MSRKKVAHRAAPAAATAPRANRWISTEIVEIQRQILRKAGKDPGLVPDVQFRYLTMAEVGEALGLSTSSIYRAIDAGTIPKPISLQHMMQREVAA